MGLRHWFRKAPPSRVERRLEFLGEQDGANERLLKADLIPMLEKAGVKRAYLARVGFQPAEATSVALCIVSDHGEDVGLVKLVADVFHRFAPSDVFLDVAFLNKTQEQDLARVCSAFYDRAS